MRLRPRTPLPTAPDCRHVAAVLQSYLDGELGPQDAEAVTDHLEHCERCGIEARTIQQVVDAIQRQRPDLASERLDRLRRFVDAIGQDGASPA